MLRSCFSFGRTCTTFFHQNWCSRLNDYLFSDYNPGCQKLHVSNRFEISFNGLTRSQRTLCSYFWKRVCFLRRYRTYRLMGLLFSCSWNAGEWEKFFQICDSTIRDATTDGRVCSSDLRIVKHESRTIILNSNTILYVRFPGSLFPQVIPYAFM